MRKKVFLIITLLCSFAFVSLADETTGSWSDYRDTTWGTDYASASSFTISTAAQLAQLAYLVNDEHKDFSGKTVTQTDNIDLCGQREPTLFRGLSCFVTKGIWQVLSSRHRAAGCRAKRLANLPDWRLRRSGACRR